jgi:hypothetical protein
MKRRADENKFFGLVFLPTAGFFGGDRGFIRNVFTA